MRTVIKLTAFMAILAVAAFAESWSGKLVDASCTSPQKTEACVPTSSTTAFALAAHGKMMKLDAEGNTKAGEALKAKENSADRAKNPNRAITATVQGTLSGDTIQVESIRLH